VTPGLPAHHAPFAAAYREAGWWIEGAAPDHLRQAAARGPGRTALVDGAGSLTYAELDALVRRAASGLLALGVAPGDAVAIQLPNRREFAIFQQAAVRIGAVYVPLLPQLRVGDLEPMLADCRARVLVTPEVYRGFDHRPMADALVARLQGLGHALSLGRDESPLRSVDAFLAEPWEDWFGETVDAARVDADAPRCILFTSGTESRSKGVVHSFNTLFFGLNRQIETFGFDAAEVVLCASPVGHGTGAVNGVEFALQIGARVVLLEAWTPAAGLQLMADEGCTLMWGAATFFSDLAQAARDAGVRLGDFRLALTAGAPVPPELAVAVRDDLGARLISAYGQSEGQNLAICAPDDPVERISGSDGRLHDAIEARLVDPERAPVAAGEAGELAYRGPNLCLGYLDAAHTAAAFDADGFIHSGDLLTLDPDRYVRVVGRRKDIIIRGGENISPAEVEGLLFGHPKVRAVSIVGYPDARLGQRACAFVAPEPGESPTLDDLTAWLGQRGVARFKHPEKIVVTDTLPMTPSGKVRKEALRELLDAEIRP
jgi:non-ribosomal peptide synthetase component E (peptide arylation enzyme)